MAHTLCMLDKATPDAVTQSGKCSQGDARYNGASATEIERQHEDHLRAVGVIDDEDASTLNNAEDET